MTDSAPPFDWRSVKPGLGLDRYVESIWYARGRIGYRRERIAPTGSTVAVFVLGDPILETPDNGNGAAYRAEEGFLLGPHTGPVVNEPTGETYAVGVVTTPIGCRPVLGIWPAKIRGRVVDLVAGWARAAVVRGRLLGSGDPEAMLTLVEDCVRANLEPHQPGLERVEGAVRMLEEDPTGLITDVASELGVSHGHLDREFTRLVGLTPRALAKVLRLRRLLAEIDVTRKIPWSGLAIELGWFDQAHLIRDFKRHTGVSPSQYIAAQLSTPAVGDPADAAGFVPEM